MDALEENRQGSVSPASSTSRRRLAAKPSRLPMQSCAKLRKLSTCQGMDRFCLRRSSPCMHAVCVHAALIRARRVSHVRDERPCNAAVLLGCILALWCQCCSLGRLGVRPALPLLNINACTGCTGRMEDVRIKRVPWNCSPTEACCSGATAERDEGPALYSRCCLSICVL